MLPPAKGLSRTPLFFPPHAHGILFFDDFRTTKVLPFITFILNRRSICDCITRKGVDIEYLMPDESLTLIGSVSRRR
jgi:hypothetical protein